ncbi:hypothetical protein F2Q69_00062144 [Brassica cretica]|uniref:Uncharacterized protein n=2 Tax=Brassica cretica TaxID=69181 RepID=A0A8S9RKX7_BRACR|nr:hypothetical protein DY000_02056615 [Brassica cretica]KAF3573894.1 hypothetical protein F2Q69_00062144 [Brassica cretica]
MVLESTIKIERRSRRGEQPRETLSDLSSTRDHGTTCGVVDERLRKRGEVLEESHREKCRLCHRRREIKKERRNQRLIHPSRRDHERSLGIKPTDFVLSGEKER